LFDDQPSEKLLFRQLVPAEATVKVL
jgi:hypothetical protein